MITVSRYATPKTAVTWLALSVLVGCADPGQSDVAPDPTGARATAASASTSVAPSFEPAVPTMPASTRTPVTSEAAQASPASLSHIAFGTDRPDINMKISDQTTGPDALEGLVPTEARAAADSELADAHRYSFAGPLDSANPRATYAHFVTYAFRYPTEGQAATAYAAIVEALDATGEWMASDTGDGLGVESWAATRDGDGGRDIGYVWHRSDLVLAILGLRDSDRAAVRDTARRMDERASSAARD